MGIGKGEGEGGVVSRGNQSTVEEIFNGKSFAAGEFHGMADSAFFFGDSDDLI